MRTHTHTHTSVSSLCSPHPTERDRGAFTPAESLTQHEACPAPVQYIWTNRFQSRAATTALYFCSIHSICMRVYIPSWFIISGAQPCIFDKGDAGMLPQQSSGLHCAASFRDVTNNLACAASHSNPSAILSAQISAFLTFYLYYSPEDVHLIQH